MNRQNEREKKGELSSLRDINRRHCWLFPLRVAQIAIRCWFGQILQQIFFSPFAAIHGCFVFFFRRILISVDVVCRASLAYELKSKKEKKRCDFWFLRLVHSIARSLIEFHLKQKQVYTKFQHQLRALQLHF